MIIDIVVALDACSNSLIFSGIKYSVTDNEAMLRINIFETAVVLESAIGNNVSSNEFPTYPQLVASPGVKSQCIGSNLSGLVIIEIHNGKSFQLVTEFIKHVIAPCFS